MRAKIVSRLIDYKWSSYKTYVYGKHNYEWLETKLILSLFSGKNKSISYREKVQEYSKEENNIWEDLRYGLIYGSEKFIKRIKTKFLSGDKNEELPQKKKIAKESNPKKILTDRGNKLNINTFVFCQNKRIAKNDKLTHDILLYIMWEMGLYTNKEIGDLFILGSSSVSRRVSMVKDQIIKNKKVKIRINNIKSIIKV